MQIYRKLEIVNLWSPLKLKVKHSFLVPQSRMGLAMYMTCVIMNPFNNIYTKLLFDHDNPNN